MAKGYTKVVEKKDGNTSITYNIDDFMLYRYRAVNDYTIESLLKDSIIGASPSTFNDPYDCTSFYMDKKTIKQIVQNVYNSKIKTIGEENILFFDFLRKFVAEIGNFLSISCFSESIVSPIMWGHYAQNATGFAVQYSAIDLINVGQKYISTHKEKMRNEFATILDVQDLLDEICAISENNLKDYGLLPVQYRNNCYNIYEFADVEQEICRLKELESIKRQKGNLTFEDEFNAWNKYHNKDFSVFNRMLFTTKRKEWKYEQEWRLCLPLSLSEMNNGVRYKSVGTLKPLAVYLGDQISDENGEKLLEIAQQKQIPIYQMYIDITKRNNQLSCYRIN